MSGEPGSFFVYAPNHWAPGILIASYGISFILHSYQCYRYKAYSLTPLQPLCAFIFTLGYALRLWAASSPSNYTYTNPETFTCNLIVYILSQVFIYVCPPLLELANYQVLGRVLFYVPYLAPLHPGKVLRVFGIIMALIEFLNALGVSLNSNPSSSHMTQEIGSHMTVAALVLQLAVILGFGGIAGTFHVRCVKRGLLVSKVRTMLLALYASMGLILVRCIYRLVEHLGNTKIDLADIESLTRLSPILRYEWWFFVFEGTLMLVNSLLWNGWHPGRYLPKDYRIYLARDGVTEVVGKGDGKDERKLWQKVVHILTFALLFGRKRADGWSEVGDELADNSPLAQQRASQGQFTT